MKIMMMQSNLWHGLKELRAIAPVHELEYKLAIDTRCLREYGLIPWIASTLNPGMGRVLKSNHQSGCSKSCGKCGDDSAMEIYEWTSWSRVKGSDTFWLPYGIRPSNRCVLKWRRMGNFLRWSLVRLFLCGMLTAGNVWFHLRAWRKKRAVKFK